ncbi:hypothetical protein DITRI_Ditri11bG0053500 [Diplodiscus trichospermus]
MTVLQNGKLVIAYQDNYYTGVHIRHLINYRSNCWITSGDQHSLTLDETSLINSRTFSGFGGSNTLKWKFTSNGKYSVSLAYSYLLQSPDFINNLTSSWSSNNWRHLWKLRQPMKMIIFLWKIGRNYVPVRFELNKRINSIEPSYPFCSSECETVDHLFWSCSFTRPVWFWM